MAASFSKYIAELVLKRLFTDGVAVVPAYTTLWIALYHDSTGTTEANLRANTPINEISETGYARIELIITGSASFTAPASGGSGSSTSNVNKLAFTTAVTAYVNDISHIALLDAVSGGNVVMFAALTPPVPVAISETPVVDVSQFSMVL